MNYDVFTGAFPVLEGYRIRLRPISHDDFEDLFYLLQDPVVIREYWIYPEAPTFREIQSMYARNTQVNFINKKSITWAIALKSNNKIIGLRDLFVDNEYKPITVQGFIESKYRRKGLSREAYNLIIDFAKSHDANGLLANTSAENTAAIALLASVGFSTDYIHHNDGDLRIVVSHDLQEPFIPFYESKEERILYNFCKMYLQGGEIDIVFAGTMKRDGALWPCYRVKTYAKNTFGPSLLDIYYADIEFVSDGVAIVDLKKSGWITYIDGRVTLSSAVAYCWDRCATEVE